MIQINQNLFYLPDIYIFHLNYISESIFIQRKRSNLFWQHSNPKCRSDLPSCYRCSHLITNKTKKHCFLDRKIMTEDVKFKNIKRVLVSVLEEINHRKEKLTFWCISRQFKLGLSLNTVIFVILLLTILNIVVSKIRPQNFMPGFYFVLYTVLSIIIQSLKSELPFCLVKEIDCFSGF